MKLWRTDLLSVKFLHTQISLYTLQATTKEQVKLSNIMETTLSKFWDGKKHQMALLLGLLKTLGANLGEKKDLEKFFQMERQCLIITESVWQFIQHQLLNINKANSNNNTNKQKPNNSQWMKESISTLTKRNNSRSNFKMREKRSSTRSCENCI